MPKRFGLCCALLALSTSALAQSKGPAARLESTLWDHDGSVVYLLALGAAREFHYKEPRGRDGGGGSASRRSAVSRRSRERPVRRHGVHLRPPLRPASLCGQRTDPRSRRARRAYRGSAAGRAKCRVQGHFTEVLEFRLQNANKTARALAPENAPSPALPTESPPRSRRRRLRRHRGSHSLLRQLRQRSLRSTHLRRKRLRRRRRRRRQRNAPAVVADAAPRRKRLRAASAAASTNCARGRCRCCPRAESGCGAAAAAINTRAGLDGGNRADASRAPCRRRRQRRPRRRLNWRLIGHRRKPRPRVQPRKHTRSKTATSCRRLATKTRTSARGNTSSWRRWRGRCCCRVLRLSCCLPSCAVRNRRRKLKIRKPKTLPPRR